MKNWILVNPTQTVKTYHQKGRTEVGFLAYMGGIVASGKGQFTFEARVRLIWPQVNPALSLNMGMRYVSQATREKLSDTINNSGGAYRSVIYHITSLPVAVQYNLVSGAVQPLVSLGVSLCIVNKSTDLELPAQDPLYNSVVVEGMIGLGIEVKITRALWARAEWRIEYKSLYPTVGVAVKIP